MSFNGVRARRELWLKDNRVIVVIGSLGKSTTVRALTCALDIPYLPAMEAVSVTTPERILLAHPRGRRHCVMEVSIAERGQMARHARALQPNIVVVTSIASDHNLTFRTLEDTRAEKAILLRGLRPEDLAVVNGDDPHTRWMAEQTQARVVFFGLDPDNAVRAENIAMDWPRGMRFRLCAKGRSWEARIGLIGFKMVYCALAAVTVALEEGIAPETAVNRLESVTPMPGRMVPIPLENGAFILDDCWKSGFETIEEALDTLADIPARRKVVVLGGITEPPTKSRELYRGLGARIGAIAQRAILCGGDIQAYSAGAFRAGLPREEIFKCRNNVHKAAEIAAKGLGPGDVVLVKGRNNEKLNRVPLLLQGRRVGCRLRSCDLKLVRCEECPKLRLSR